MSRRKITSKNKLRDWHRDESGQVAFLFIFGMIAVVFLIALIFNTAHQSIRKDEVQNASDAAVKTGAVDIGRGMNIVASNNRGMTQMISTMIVVRSTLQTAEAMTKILPGMIAAATFLNPGLAAQLSRELANYVKLISVLRPIDRSTERFGWQMMSALDKVNQSVKTGFPRLAQLESIDFARRNGADLLPYSVLIPGLPAAPPLLLPIGRGPQKYTVIEAEQCVLGRLKSPVRLLFVATGPVSSGVAIGVFEGMMDCNASSLKDSASFCQTLAYTPMLRWPPTPPKPMLLTDSPSRSASATVTAGESAADLTKVRKYLQILNFSFARLSKESPIGTNYFENPAGQWIAYAQADVYNPTRWSMFSQDWRAQLVRARLFNEKLGQLGRIAGLPIPTGSPSDWSFVNVH